MRIQFVSEVNLSNPQANEGKLLYANDTDEFYICTGDNYNKIIMNRSGNVGINIKTPQHALSIVGLTNNMLKMERGTNIFEITMSTTGRININGDLNLSTVLNCDSGGTGLTSFALDDLVVGNNSNGLKKISKSNVVGSMLINGRNGLEYSTHMFKKYLEMSDPVFVSSNQVTIGYVYCRNSADTDYIFLESINLNTNNNLQGGQVSGQVSPNPESTILTSSITGFTPTVEYRVGDAITVNGETRRIMSNNPLTVNSVFTTLPLWSLSGAATMSATQSKFGGKSFNSAATTALGTVLTRTNTPSLYTIECFLFINSTATAMNIFSSATANSFLVGFARNPMNFTVSIGQGASFNIANAVRLATTVIAATTWYHLAVVRNSTQYRFFVNGVEQNSVTSALQITSAAFNSFILGNGTTTYNGFIDEFRLSDSVRYTGNFTPTTSAFTKDTSAISLNHFDGTTITSSDDCSYELFNHFRNQSLVLNQVLYVYAQQNKLFITPRSVETDVADFDNGITSNDIRKLPYYYITNGSNVLYAIVKNTNSFDITPNITLINASTSSTAVVVSLVNFVPIDVNKIKLLITHTHVGTISAGIVVGTTSTLYNTYLTTNVASTTYLIIDVPVFNQSISAYLSVLASTTSFTLSLVGFSV